MLAEAPPRALPAGALVEPSSVAHSEFTLTTKYAQQQQIAKQQQAAIRGVLHPSSNAAALSLPQRAALLSQLATIPPKLLVPRQTPSPSVPIMSKGNQCVYADPARKNGSIGYVLRPNLRKLKDSDDPVTMKALASITSLPVSLQQSQQHHSHRNGHPSNPHSSSSSDRLHFIRAPRKSAAEESARVAQEIKEAQDDYEAGGMKPRPIKSVAALLSQGVGNPAVKGKPTHLRLGSMKTLAAAAVNAAKSPTGAIPEEGDVRGGGSNLRLKKSASSAGAGVKGAAAFANFARGLRMTSSNASAAGPVDGGAHESEEEKVEEEQAAVAQADDDELPADEDAAGAGAAAGGAADRKPGEKEKVVVSAEKGSTCCICTTSDFVEPWISQCKHICCSECWSTWLNENPDKTCPECDAPISLEELRAVSLCPICSAIPTDPWTAPCRHTCCKECWLAFLEENPVCPECNEPVVRADIPQ